MIEEKAEEAKAKTAERAKPEDFKVAYPEYYEILSKYSDSKLFRAESADRLNGTLSLNAVDQTMMSGFGLESCQTASNRPVRVGKGDWKRQQHDSFSSGGKARLQTASARPTSKNLTISYQHSTTLKSNFDHTSRPFATKKNKTSDKSAVHPSQHYWTSQQLKDAQTLDDYSSIPMQFLEHGNYKLFGFSKNKAFMPNKFLATTPKDFTSTRTATTTQFTPKDAPQSKRVNLNSTFRKQRSPDQTLIE